MTMSVQSYNNLVHPWVNKQKQILPKKLVAVWIAGKTTKNFGLFLPIWIYSAPTYACNISWQYNDTIDLYIFPTDLAIDCIAEAWFYAKLIKGKYSTKIISV